MSSLRETIRSLFTPVRPLPPGSYHYQAPPADERSYRLLLRLEADGQGILIVNASTILHLNPTAAEYAFYLVQNLPEDQVAKNMAARYRVPQEKALQDYRDFKDRIDTLISTPDLDPVTFLDFERQEPFSGEISAPYRLDCALTYRLPEGAAPAAAPTDRVTRELTTDEWKTVLDKAWNAGIPHVIFTGGEPTLREDLADLIVHAEKNNQVTGLMTDGLRLAGPEYLDSLLQSGLDHLTLILRPEIETSWTALQQMLAADLFVAVHLTLNEHNQEQLASLLERLAGMGVHAVSLSASSLSLADQLDDLRGQAASLNLDLVWNLPVPYSALNPVALETDGMEEPEGAGKAWLYVEPDGDVLPAQGIQRRMGNLLTDPWEQIWS